MKNRADARALAESLVSNGRANGVHTEALLTSMDAPLGRAVGNALEIKEAIQTLKGQGPVDLEGLSVMLAARMLLAGDITKNEADAVTKIRAAITTGQGLEKFRSLIAHQGGDPRVCDDFTVLPAAPHQRILRAERPGFVTAIDAEKVGLAAMHLGAGRSRMDDVIDPAVGCIVLAPVGCEVQAGAGLVEIHYRDADRLAVALRLFTEAWTVEDRPVPATEMILERL